VPARVERHKTAIGRRDLSRPTKLAIEAGLINSDRSFFDYGCGRGDDARQLSSLGISASGWDPTHPSTSVPLPADVVNLGYVINVIEDPAERDRVLRAAWGLASSVLVVSARLTSDVKAEPGKPYRDGVLTRLGTFQKFFGQLELRSWIDSTLGVSACVAAPGVFFVFREPALCEAYLASRYTRRRAAPKVRKSDLLFEQHREILQPLMEFVSSRARLPTKDELPVPEALVAAFGSIPRAFSVVKKVTGTDHWDEGRVVRFNDLLVHFALARFGRRPRFSDLPPDLQIDVREFFSSYKNACESADRLLFSAGNTDLIDTAMKTSSIGKLTGSALYVHTDAVTELAPVLRVYEGCARQYVGVVDDANLIKLHRREPRVSYLSYPDFDRDPHPVLAFSVIASLSGLDYRVTDYRARQNPPILHRKETFLARDDSRRGKFERLTAQEERWGLYAQPEHIGTRAGWQAVLDENNCQLRGHRLIHLKN